VEKHPTIPALSVKKKMVFEARIHCTTGLILQPIHVLGEVSTYLASNLLSSVPVNW
jgi:hypothetical protein